ncbi:MAG TPA: type II toxin-antitoxin system prevent-host-death family antitoxin [Verrucomicrobiae bacterium]|nr:type II toxin-antitoxin system prevent-host-death family antitoxin [Verrucomicrobiae bacterium]
MKTINIQAAKTHLSRLVEEAVAGEEIVLAKAGRPMVRLMPFQPSGTRRKLGRFKGKVKERPGCWDADSNLETEFSERPLLPAPRGRKSRERS